MLSRIIVKNFKCFKNETVFDFRKTNYKLLKQNTKGKLLKGLLFVGDNASGKTTAIQPVMLLLDLLFKDRDISLFLYQCLFSKEDETTLKYEFDIDGHEILYSFSFDGNKFLEETLQLDNQPVIERIGKNAKLWLSENSTFHEVDESILFIKKVYFNTKFEDNEMLKKWFAFLKQSICINAYKRTISSYNDESLTLRKYLEKYGVEEINSFLKNNNFKYSVEYALEIEGKGIRYEMSEEEGKTLFFKREDISVPIPLFFESTGNKTLINILPAILHAVQKGGLLVIDEFSSGFHNKLEELIIRYIMNNSTNTQMLLVSHSTNLLSNALLRPDQVYSVEMMGGEGSVLNRFSDEQPRVAQNIEKMYLSGVFGGIPEYETDKE